MRHYDPTYPLTLHEALTYYDQWDKDDVARAAAEIDRVGGVEFYVQTSDTAILVIPKGFDRAAMWLRAGSLVFRTGFQPDDARDVQPPGKRYHQRYVVGLSNHRAVLLSRDRAVLR